MRRTLVMALLLAVVALGAGVFVTVQTFPSDEEIQRLTLEEIGIDPSVLDNPLVGAIIEDTFGRIQEQVRERVLDESRQSMYLGAGATVGVTVLGVVAISSDHRRRGATG